MLKALTRAEPARMSLCNFMESMFNQSSLADLEGTIFQACLPSCCLEAVGLG